MATSVLCTKEVCNELVRNGVKRSCCADPEIITHGGSHPVDGPDLIPDPFLKSLAERLDTWEDHGGLVAVTQLFQLGEELRGRGYHRLAASLYDATLARLVDGTQDAAGLTVRALQGKARAYDALGLPHKADALLAVSNQLSRMNGGPR